MLLPTLPRGLPRPWPAPRGGVALGWGDHVGLVALEGRIIAGDRPGPIATLSHTPLERLVIPGATGRHIG